MKIKNDIIKNRIKEYGLSYIDLKNEIIKEFDKEYSLDTLVSTVNGRRNGFGTVMRIIYILDLNPDDIIDMGVSKNE